MEGNYLQPWVSLRQYTNTPFHPTAPLLQGALELSAPTFDLVPVTVAG
jgi:hypothetical protein